MTNNLVTNRQAFHDYEILDKFEAGIILQGFEVKSVMNGMCELKGAYVDARGKDILLKQMHVTKWNTARGFEEKIDEKRSRILLLNKSEKRKIVKMITEKGLTVIPLDIHYSKSRKVKVTIAVARGRKKQDKRQMIKERDTKRELQRESKYV